MLKEFKKLSIMIENRNQKIKQLEDQLIEKDQKIEKLSNDCNKLWVSREQADIDRMKAEIKQTQLAIQEFEKVSELIKNRENFIFENKLIDSDIYKYELKIFKYIREQIIDKQIKKLKGE